MTRPSRSIETLPDTSYYHVTVRCVRQAFLSGVDAHTGHDYSHREAWVLERLAQLSAAFCIDVCAYAIARTHYELVLYVDRARGEALPADEVLYRWSTLWQTAERSGGAQVAVQSTSPVLAEERRAQLCEISAFMRHLNQPLARRANLEDRCTGSFWEKGFKLRALPDATRLLAAMAYIDLSPFRLPLPATVPCGSTSIQARIERAYRTDGARCVLPLLEFAAPHVPAVANRIPCTFRDYLELLEWTGRKMRADPLEASAPRTPYLLQHLSVDAEIWLTAMQSSLETARRKLPLPSAGQPQRRRLSVAVGENDAR